MVLPLDDEVLPLYDAPDDVLSFVTTAGLRESDCGALAAEADVALPVETDVALSVALLSLIVGVVLTAVVLLEDTLVGTDAPETVVLPDDGVLPVATLPEDAPLTAVEPVRTEDSLLLTVLLLPIPPLIEDVPAKSLSEPVWCLDPYQTSLLLSWTWPGPW